MSGCEELNKLIVINSFKSACDIRVPGLLAATTSGRRKQAWHIPDAVCTVLELLMMGGETARNMWSIDYNKEYCITLHLVGVLKRIVSRMFVNTTELRVYLL